MRLTTADIILNNANIITCDPGRPEAQALAIKGDRILLVGFREEVDQVKGPDTQIIDCQCKTLVPGFNDAHCHVFSLVRKFLSLDLSPRAVHSIEDIKEAIRHRIHFSSQGRWISGIAYNEFYLKEKRHPTRWDLDEVAPDNPVILIHRSLHAAVLNSLALKMAGITNNSEEPPGGIIDRDLDTGEPNGILYEMLDYIRTKIQVPVPNEETDWGISKVNHEYLSHGITSIGEATLTNNFEQWKTFLKLKQAEKLKSRVFMMPGIGAFNEFKYAGRATGFGDNQLKLGGLKIVLSETTGKLHPSQKELNQMVLKASQSGFQVAIHAVSQSEVEAAVGALEYSQKQSPQTGKRHRIEHCSECTPEIRRRLSDLKAVIVSQPPFIYYSGERYLSRIPIEAQSWLYPFKSLMDHGLTVAGSSDSPVVPNNPLIGIYAAATRLTESGQVLLPEETISAKEALDMYTLNAAYATFEEKIKGSLTPGKLADVVVLSADPLHSHPEKIKGIKVEMTIVGGKVVYEI